MPIIYYIRVRKPFPWLLQRVTQNVSRVFSFHMDVTFSQRYLSLICKFSQFETLEYL